MSSPAKAKPFALLVCVALAVATVAVFWGARQCDFVNYDDPAYVKDNEVVQRGLTAQSVRWAFETGAASNWHPLTWLSHMADVQLYGMNPAGHHLTSVFLHAMNAVLLFLLLRRMTGALWPSAFVAAIFALHPLRVESVVWISERKDVLSTLFWMLTVWAYVRYAEEFKIRRGATQFFASWISPSPSQTCGGEGLGEEAAPLPNPLPAGAGRGDKKPARAKALQKSKMRYKTSLKVDYCLTLVFFSLGLMAKPMLVTLPVILLLLDYWPLGRVSRGVRTLVLEKIPFFVLAVASSVVTFVVQRRGGAVAAIAGVPLAARIGNAFVSYVRYVGKIFWPTRLSPLYPHPGYWPWWEVAGAVVVLVAITAWVIWRARAQPYLAVGWFWFVIMLAPTIGLVQVGIQSMADRYSYVASVGVLIMLAWGLNEWVKTQRWTLPSIASFAVLACVLLTVRQVTYWHNSETLFLHAVEVTDNNYLACNNLGTYLSDKGETERSMVYFQKSLAINSNYDEAHNNLGYALAALGRYQEATNEYIKALSLNSNLTEAHNNLGIALGHLGLSDAGIHEYQVALEENPQFADAHNNYGVALAMHGQLDDAIAQFRLALASKPNYLSAHSDLGNALAIKGDLEGAIREYELCLKIDPNDAQVHNNLGNALTQKGSLEDAAAQYRLALQLKPENPEAHLNLGYCLARLGRRTDAEAQYNLALQQRPDYPEAQRQLKALKDVK